MFHNALNLTTAIPDADAVFALTPEDLGGVLLELVHRGLSQGGRFSFLFFMMAVDQNRSPQWPEFKRPQVRLAVAEAMAWLEQSGLIMADFDQAAGKAGTEFRMLTRRGQTLRDRAAVQAYAEAGILPAGLVHPKILARVHSAFIRGDHQVATFAAFHALEVAVREAGGFGQTVLGVDLMRSAFRPNQGPLANQELPTAEQEAEAHLFAGAIGAAKNPASHRDVEISRIEAARLILFASHLMSIVDARAARTVSVPA
jgi:uncharacterized protein (TIGR02391 family)